MGKRCNVRDRVASLDCLVESAGNDHILYDGPLAVGLVSRRVRDPLFNLGPGASGALHDVTRFEERECGVGGDESRKMRDELTVTEGSDMCVCEVVY